MTNETKENGGEVAAVMLAAAGAVLAVWALLGALAHLVLEVR